MAFGAGFKKTGQYGAPGLKKIAELGTTAEAFNAENNLTQESKKKDFLAAYNRAKAKQTAPTTIDANFEFTDLPQVGGNQATQGLRDTASNLGNQANQSFGSGAASQTFGENSLAGLLGNVSSEYGGRAADEYGARLRSLQQQGQAIDPTLGVGSQRFLQEGQDQRMNAINQFYGAGGPAREQLARNLASNIAGLDQLGVGGTGEGAVLGNTISNFNRDYAQATQAAQEASRGEALGERNRVAGTYGDFAGKNLSDAQSTGALRGNLLGLGRNIGSDLTSSGAQRQAIGAELAKLGLSAESTGLSTDLAQRQLEAELQQGEKAFQTDLTQQQIDNERIRRAIQQNKRLQKYLMAQGAQSGSGGGMSGALGGAASGAALGSFFGPIGTGIGAIGGGILGAF
jgi:hypothetical protein